MKATPQPVEFSNSRAAPTLLPSSYLNLFRGTAGLNRVHNGDDLEKTVRILKKFCDENLKGESTIHFFKPGDVFNFWTIPERWDLKYFSLTAEDGTVIANEQMHPLVVGSFSDSVDLTLSLDELKAHTLTRPDIPEAYSFYFRQMYRHWEKGWKISLPAQTLERLKPGQYRLIIQAERSQQPMPVFEYVQHGKSNKTIFLCGHIDHPGMVNDSLSGSYACLQIVDALQRLYGKTEFTYRVLLVPEIIGSTVFLKQNEFLTQDALFALCPNMTSHDAPLAFCRSKSGNSLLDLALRLALQTHVGTESFVEGAFHRYPDCGDEISFDTVGYQIPTPTLSRIGMLFREYHTSADNFELFNRPESLRRHQTLVEVLVLALRMIEENLELQTDLRGNPCLSHPSLDLYLDSSNVNNLSVSENTKRSLTGDPVDLRNFMEHFLNALSIDGISILEIAHSAQLPFDFVRNYASRTIEKGIVRGRPCYRQHALATSVGTSLQIEV